MKTVFITNEDAELSSRLRTHCESLGLHVHFVVDAMHVLLDARLAEPDLILLNASASSANCLDVCQTLNSDSQLCSIPVIAIGTPDPETKLQFRDYGAFYTPIINDVWDCLGPLIRRILKIKPEQSTATSLILNNARLLKTCSKVGPASIDYSSEVPTQVGDKINNANRENAPRRPRVLCIDDDPDISKAIKMRLEFLDIEVAQAYSGMEGYWTCLEFQPDVVITDLNMPDGEGNYILYRLRSNPLTKNIPVIILSGQRNPAIRRQLLSLGADAYLTKPLVFDELVTRLKRHINLLPHSVPR